MKSDAAFQADTSVHPSGSTSMLGSQVCWPKEACRGALCLSSCFTEIQEQPDVSSPVHGRCLEGEAGRCVLCNRLQTCLFVKPWHHTCNRLWPKHSERSFPSWQSKLFSQHSCVEYLRCRSILSKCCEVFGTELRGLAEQQPYRKPQVIKGCLMPQQFRSGDGDAQRMRHCSHVQPLAPVQNFTSP